MSSLSRAARRARNRVDDWTYAIKVKNGGPHGVSRSSLNEMFALAALGSHPNVIRYYNAWIEDARLYLQCEYCAGGSVAQRVDGGGRFDEPELRTLLRQMAEALSHIHAHKLVHLDVKPENIFIARGGPEPVVIDPCDRTPRAGSLYKLGDLGLINMSTEVRARTLRARTPLTAHCRKSRLRTATVAICRPSC